MQTYENVNSGVAAFWMKAGPCRPQYHVIPASHLEGARESGRRWKALHTQLGAR